MSMRMVGSGFSLGDMVYVSFLFLLLPGLLVVIKGLECVVLMLMLVYLTRMETAEWRRKVWIWKLGMCRLLGFVAADSVGSCACGG